MKKPFRPKLKKTQDRCNKLRDQRFLSWWAGLLVILLALVTHNCVFSNLDNSFELKNGGVLFGLFLINVSNNADGCRFDTGTFDNCQFGF
ncbi:MAG: hypothetical protein KDK39_08640 [Leptospiraceae bacterium]|nr:hypothetical protein [Leptospiraceae bacterium]